MGDTAVRAINVCKGFGSGDRRIEVLRGLDLDAHAGEILLLAGPSGCGKTTLLCLIAGLLDTDSGEINLFGTSIGGLSNEEKTAFRRDNIGFVFQQYNLIPTLSTIENAAVPLLIKGVPRREAHKRAIALLERTGLSKRMRSLPLDLSGGEQQRVAISRALVSEPRLLICDEPTAALDGETGAKIMELLRSVALDSGRCVIIVTHDMRVFKYGDRIARMLDGKITTVEKNEQVMS